MPRCKTRQSSLFAKVDARDNATAALAMCQASASLRRHRLSLRDIVHQPEHAEQRLLQMSINRHKPCPSSSGTRPWFT